MAFDINDDIKIPTYSASIWFWDRETGTRHFMVDVTNVMISDIQVEKERNIPDSLTMTVEYTQFKKRLAKEDSLQYIGQRILVPWLTEVVIKRTDDNLQNPTITIFSGTLYSMEVNLSAVGKEELVLKCLGYGELLNKRYVSRGYGNMSYPQICQMLVMDGQHELNWIENYAFEASENDAYTSEWLYNNLPIDYETHRLNRASEAPWSQAPLWYVQRTGVGLRANDYITTRTQGAQDYNGEKIYFSCYYACPSNATLTLTFYNDKGSQIGQRQITLSASSTWKRYNENESWEDGAITFTIPAGNIHQVSIRTNVQLAITEIQLYRQPQNYDYYDLDLSIGSFDDNGVPYETNRIRHYHQQNIKDAMFNLTKLEDDNFEFQFDENKKINIWRYHGRAIADPAFIATYPGEVSKLSLNRDIASIVNVNYASGDEEVKYTVATRESDGSITETEKQFTRVWKTCDKDSNSLERFGAMCQFNSYDGINSQEELDIKAAGENIIFADLNDIPKVEVDSNIYNPSNCDLGDAVGVKVLDDSLFEYVNGTYRVFSYSLSVSIDSVEKMSFTLVPATTTQLQIIKFPKAYKNLVNDVRRLLK